MPWLSSPDHIDIDAMQGPTTVSALIHAATMVKAGIYLISRMFLIFPLGLSDFFSSWSIIVIISGLTAVIAGFSAIMSIDFKRILAYSTVSQLAFMFLSIGLAFTVEENHLLSSNAFYATQLHLLAHAFFKSLLFLSAGYIIHTYHTRNLNELRGILNWEKEKYVLISFLIGCFALVGLPPMNGFFSKEAIIDVSYEIGFVDGLLIGQIAFFFIVLTAILTALYTGKMLFYLTFNAKGSKISDSRHNSVHKSIIMPSIISLLGLLTVITAIFSFYIPDFFNDVISSQPFEIIKLNNLLIPLIILILIIISLALSIILLKDYSLSLNKLSSVFGISIIYELSKNGFYFDQLIMFIWDIVQKFANKFKHLHPGDLNYTVFLMSGFSFLLLIIFMIGGL
jgi:NADH-quinone oxidoreductase subunit L